MNIYIVHASSYMFEDANVSSYTAPTREEGIKIFLDDFIDEEDEKSLEEVIKDFEESNGDGMPWYTLIEVNTKTKEVKVLLG